MEVIVCRNDRGVVLGVVMEKIAMGSPVEEEAITAKLGISLVINRI